MNRNFNNDSNSKENMHKDEGNNKNEGEKKEGNNRNVVVMVVVVIHSSTFHDAVLK